jgi:hypothetical protein
VEGVNFEKFTISLIKRKPTAENAAVLEANKSILNKSDAKLIPNSSAYIKISCK